jgi:predicted double-glycine peptidase
MKNSSYMKGIVVFLAFLQLSFSAKENFPDIPASYLKVPLVRQAYEYSCGAAALLSVLYYWNIFDGGEADLYEPLKTSEEQGTSPRSILSVAQSMGLEGEIREGLTLGDLEVFLAQGKTVILDIVAWPEPPEPNRSCEQWLADYENGHYVVLVGIDEKNVYFMDPSTAGRYAFIPRDELLWRWHDADLIDQKLVKNHHLGIILSGKNARNFLPTSTSKIE